MTLVRQAQAGEREALNHLFERYYERVQRIVRIRLGRKLRRVVETGDILQNTFAAAVRCFDRFEMLDEASLIHWLAKLVERQISDAHDYHDAGKRKAGRGVSLEGLGDDGDDAWEPAGNRTAPWVSAAREEDRELVDRCIAELPPAYRELIVLRNYEGHEWEAIAQQLERPSAGAARAMYQQAKLTLAKLIRKRRAELDESGSR